MSAEDQDKRFFKTFGVVMAIIGGIAVASFIGAYIITASADDDELRPEQIMLTMKRTDPVYRVVTSASAAQAAAAGGSAQTEIRSGKAVFKAVCSTCHTTGMLGAPKVSNTAQWKRRFSKGIETLYSHAIHGFGKMPPQGATLPEKEVKAAVRYILKRAGVATIGGPSQAKDKTASGNQPEAKGKSAAAGKSPDKQQAKTANKSQGKGKASAGATSQGQQKTAASAASAGKGPTTTAAASKSNLKMGKKVFKSLCHTCHVPGLMGAPKVSDTAEWKQRLAKRGLETLDSHAIHGFKAMPPKGGDPSLSNKQVKAAVDYMLHKAGVK